MPVVDRRSGKAATSVVQLFRRFLKLVKDLHAGGAGLPLGESGLAGAHPLFPLVPPRYNKTGQLNCGIDYQYPAKWAELLSEHVHSKSQFGNKLQICLNLLCDMKSTWWELTDV